MPDQADESIEHLVEMHRRHQGAAGGGQHLANRITHALSRPLAITVLVLLTLAWVGGNLGAMGLHARPLEEAPFPELALVLGFVAVIVALLILTTQSHSEELADKRSELTLQMALLSERKIAKVIQLLEEQRRDNPLLTARVDAEADRMAEPADPRGTLERIEAVRAEEEASIRR